MSYRPRLTSAMINAVITADTVNNHVTADTVNGHISSQKVNSLVTANTVNNHVTADTVNGHVSSQKVNSLVTADTVNNHVTADTVNGHISSQKVNSMVTADRVNALIDMSGLPNDVKSILAGMGSNDIGVPVLAQRISGGPANIDGVVDGSELRPANVYGHSGAAVLSGKFKAFGHIPSSDPNRSELAATLFVRVE